MNLERLKKTLANVGIATLIAGSTLTVTGCATTGSPEGDKSGTVGQSACSGQRSGTMRGGGSCGWQRSGTMRGGGSCGGR